MSQPPYRGDELLRQLRASTEQAIAAARPFLVNLLGQARFRPRYHAEVCPLCKGSGTEEYPRGGIRADNAATTNIEMTCHGCAGKGWVEVRNG